MSYTNKDDLHHEKEPAFSLEDLRKMKERLDKDKSLHFDHGTVFHAVARYTEEELTELEDFIPRGGPRPTRGLRGNLPRCPDLPMERKMMDWISETYGFEGPSGPLLIEKRYLATNDGGRDRVTYRIHVQRYDPEGRPYWGEDLTANNFQDGLHACYMALDTLWHVVARGLAAI